MLDLAGQIPGFGGLYVSIPSVGGRPDNRAPLHVFVYLTAEGDTSLARNVVTQRFGSEGRQIGQMSFLSAAFTFRQLYDWRDRLRPILATTGAVTLDANEGRNRVTVGVDAESSIPAIRDLLPTLGVPANAVHFEVSAAWFPNSMRRGRT